MQYYNKHEARFGSLELQKDVVPINERMGGLCESIDYYNNLDFSVTVGKRDGSKLTCRPMNNPHVPKRFYITLRSTIDHSKVGLTLPDPTLHQENAVTHNAYYQAFQNANKGQSVLGYSNTAIFQYAVDAAELREFGTFYLDTVDIIVSIERNDLWEHPFSPAGLYKSRIINTPTLNDVNSFTLSIEIVSPDNTLKEKFVNLNNLIYRVPINHSPNRRPGIYISYNGLTDITKPPTPAMSDYYPLEELFKPKEGKDRSSLPFVLYDTMQEAMVHGDLEAQRKHALDQAKYENDRMKAEIERLKLDHANIEQERKRLADEHKWVADEMKAILDKKAAIEENVRKEVQEKMEEERQRYKLQYDLDAMRRKDEFEQRQYERKESSEFIKWLPTILGGFMAILTFMMKMQPQK